MEDIFSIPVIVMKHFWIIVAHLELNLVAIAILSFYGFTHLIINSWISHHYFLDIQGWYGKNALSLSSYWSIDEVSLDPIFYDMRSLDTIISHCEVWIILLFCTIIQSNITQMCLSFSSIA